MSQLHSVALTPKRISLYSCQQPAQAACNSPDHRYLMLLAHVNTIELDPEKLKPLDLLPLLELDEEPELADRLGPVPPPVLSEIPGPPLDDDGASLCVQTPSARWVLVPGTRIATVRTRPSMRSSSS